MSPESRPQPTMSVDEIVREMDGRNLVKLGTDLIAYMPPRYKTHLRTKGFLQMEIRGYSIQITDNDRFK